MILITAFKPFDNRSTNASSETLKRLELDDNYIKAYIKVSIDGVDNTLNEYFNNYKIDKVIMLGESGKDVKIAIEHRAHNLMNFRIEDEDHNKPIDIVINESLEKEAYTNIYPYKCFKDERINKYIKESIDPGYFICNYGYFKALEKNKNSLFIHLPLIDNNENDNYHRMDIDKMVETVKMILEDI